MNRNIIIDKTKRLYEKAKKRYKEEKTYRVISSNDDTKLDGLYDCLQQYIYLSNDRQVVSIKVSDGEYLVSLGDNQTINDLSDKNIEKGNLDNYECKSYNEK